MAQYDVYRNSNPYSSDEIPYLMEIQAELLSHLSTRMVIPLSSKAKALKHLNPVFVIEGRAVVLMTQEMAGIEKVHLGQKIASMSEYRNEIIASIDFLISGF